MTKDLPEYLSLNQVEIGMKVTEVNITPVKPRDGLVAFASIVVDENLYLGSIAIYTKTDGSYRLLYPTKVTNNRSINLFHPINRNVSKQIEDSIFEKCNEIFENVSEPRLYIL